MPLNHRFHSAHVWIGRQRDEEPRLPEHSEEPIALAMAMADFVNHNSSFKTVAEALLTTEHHTLQAGVFRMFFVMLAEYAKANDMFFDGRNQAVQRIAKDIQALVDSGKLNTHIPFI